MIENHVVSLELSKKLKELGVKQESEFYWNKKGKVTRVKHIKKYYCYLSEASTEVEGYDIVGRNVSAFLSSELGEMLPAAITLTRKTVSGTWIIPNLGGIEIESVSEADARAKLLIHLIENSIIDVKSL